MGLAFLAGALLLAPLGVAAALALLFGTFLIGQSLYRLTIGEYVLNAWAHIPVAKHEGSTLSTVLMGDFGAIKAAQPGEQHAKWIRELGSVFRYRHMFGTPRIFISDPKAMLYIHGPARAYKYPKSNSTRIFLDAVMGEGLITVEGEKHRRERRIISPAFTNAAVRELQPVMEKHGASLAAKIGQIIDGAVARRAGKTPFDALQDGESPPDARVALNSWPGSSAVVDVLFWASRTALDVIGDAGFNYQFNSLEHGNADELSEAYNNLMTACMDVDLVQAFTILLSEIRGLGWMRGIPTRRQKMIASARATSQRYATQIVSRAKQEIAGEVAATIVPSMKHKLSSAGLRKRASHASGLLSGQMTPLEKSDESGDDKATLVADDDAAPAVTSRAPSVLTKEAFDDVQTTKSGSLLHRVIRANMAADLRPNERLTDEELEGVPATFLLAGSETSATQTSWTLRLMAEHPAVQERLRAEILAAKKAHELEGSAGTYEGCLVGDVHALPYLECCIKESLRLMTALPSTVREATEDDVVPLSKPYRSADGKSTFDSVVIPKGHELFVPIAAVGLDAELWGPDAHEYKPERWDASRELPSAVKALPGPGLYSFISGPRNCVGQRFAQTEIKVLMAHLLSAFKFEVVPGWELSQRQMIARRALIVGQEQYGTRMPLIVSRL